MKTKKITSLSSGIFKLDGGAMFGVVPKSIWNKLNPADETNLCSWEMRCLLVEFDHKKILIDTGMGTKQSPEFLKHFKLDTTENLLHSLSNQNIMPSEITDVFFTHLHFDHCGGAFYKNNEGKILETFPKANYWVSESHWSHAKNPNAREKVSFMAENILPIEQSGKLKLVSQNYIEELDIEVFMSNGHTIGQMIPVLKNGEDSLAFVADLIPSVWHIPLSYLAAYDIQALEAMREKEAFLQRALKENMILFFQHDPLHWCCTLKMTDKGIRADELN